MCRCYPHVVLSSPAQKEERRHHNFHINEVLEVGLLSCWFSPPSPLPSCCQPSLPVDGSSKVQHPALPLLGSQERERGPGASASTLGILVVPQQGLQGGKLRIKVLGWESRADTHWDAQKLLLFHGGEPELLRLNQTPHFFTQASVDVRILKLLCFPISRTQPSASCRIKCC